MRGNIAQLMQQAQKMQEDVQRAQEEVAGLEVVGNAGGGMVSDTVTGKRELKDLVIKPECVDPEDVEMLQDMILAAVNDALDSAETMAGQQMSAVTGGLNIPGLF